MLFKCWDVLTGLVLTVAFLSMSAIPVYACGKCKVRIGSDAVLATLIPIITVELEEILP